MDIKKLEPFNLFFITFIYFFVWGICVKKIYNIIFIQRLKLNILQIIKFNLVSKNATI